MNLLAFDTSTETLSIAVAAGGNAAVQLQEPGGARASAQLIPAIGRLLAEAGVALPQLDAIVFGRGPGSFTGLRTACAVAQGLAFGAGVPVLPVDTLLAVAEDAHASAGCERVVALLDARMDEVYCAAYQLRAGAWQQERAPWLGRPEDVQAPAGWVLAGNAAAVHGPRLPPAPVVPALPTAGALLRLAPALLAAGQAVSAAHALPLYLRDKVAQTTQERAAARRQTA